MNDKPSNSKMESSNIFGKVTRSLKKESQRGSVIVATAWFDEGLTAILEKKLVPVKDEDLFKAGGPLGDFGNKIKLAYRLGLIPKTMVRSLTIFRKLRNDFAHLSSDINFDTPSVKDRISELFQLNKPLIGIMGEVLQEAGQIKTKPETSKDLENHLGIEGLFHYLCGLIATALDCILQSTEQSGEFLSDI